jgi:hypothetical protein
VIAFFCQNKTTVALIFDLFPWIVNVLSIYH